MEIKITTRKAHLSETFKDRAQKKLDHLNNFFYEENVVANIVASSEKERETIELTIKAGSLILRAQKTTSNFIESFDMALSAIMKQLFKNKTKLGKRLKVKAYDNNYDELLDTYDKDIDDLEEFKIVKNKKFIIKPMSAQEAILQMNLIGHEFYLFKDDNTYELNIIYRRHDDTYGLIEAATSDDGYHQ